jgi:drug/metabolite transporter (DMT)-like permease
MQFTPRQFFLLAGLTLVWGINWPIMKLGVTDYPPLAFRAVALWLGLPVLGLVLVATKTTFKVPRRHWRELVLLAVTNMILWNTCIILAVKGLTSGRSAILGYTMPVFSAVIGAAFFSAVLTRRGWLGVLSCALGVALLLWHELTHLTGRPAYVVLALAAAATWALGTQLLRRTRIEAPTLTLSFWMTTLAAFATTLLSLMFEHSQWGPPGHVTWSAIIYNAVLVFGFAQAAWFYLARGLPPVASTLSVMLIPVIGVFSGAFWLDEPVYWQDWTAIVLMMASIASVLWPARGPGAVSG